MVEGSMTNPLSYINVRVFMTSIHHANAAAQSLQHVVAMLFELMFGARPSSLYATKAWPECYLLWEVRHCI